MIYRAEYNNLPTLDLLVRSLKTQLQRLPVVHRSPIEPIVSGKDCFIVTRLMSGRYSLKPNISMSCALFRGQSEIVDKCKAVADRKPKPRCTAENVVRAEFELLIESHPIYQLLKNGINLFGKTYRIENPYGLAMAYGFPTSLIPLTSDLEIASFYAVTAYDSQTDSYLPVKRNNENKTGILYVFNLQAPFAMIPGLSSIGLQPFERTGLQRDFALNLPKDKGLEDHPFVVGFEFRHDDDVSQRIYVKFSQGERLMPKSDVLAEKVRTILRSSEISEDAVQKNITDNPKDSPDRIRDEVKAGGLTIVADRIVTFSEDDLAPIYNDPLVYWQDFCRPIVFGGSHASRLKEALLNVPNMPEYKRYFQPNR